MLAGACMFLMASLQAGKRNTGFGIPEIVCSLGLLRRFALGLRALALFDVLHVLVFYASQFERLGLLGRACC